MARILCSSLGFTYRSTISILFHLPNCFTVITSVLHSVANRVAEVCRKACGVTPVSLARLQAPLKAVLKLLSLLTPSFFTNNHSLKLLAICSLKGSISCGCKGTVDSRSCQRLDSGDILGQMAAPDYPESLYGLYQEFAEAAAYSNANGSWIEDYSSAEDLMKKTRNFYEGYVQWMLQTQWGGVHESLSHHFGNGKNPYLERIEVNIEDIEQRVRTAEN